MRCCAPGSPRFRTSARHAALLNSVHAQVLEWEDWTFIAHSGASIVPAALAAGELAHASGKQLVAASWKAVRIYDYAQPVFMNQKDAATALQTMEAASDQLATGLHEPTTSPVPAMPPAPVYAPEHAPA